MANNQQDKRTASQRIDDLERGLMGIYQTADNMARDLMLAKDAIKLLGNKVQSIVQLLASGSAVNDDALSKQMIDNNIAELKEKVTNLVSQGILVPAVEVTDTSFIVGREINDQGEVVNPRLQFALNALGEELKSKIKAAKIGDTVTLQEGKLKFDLLEVYSIQVPKAPEAAPAPAEAADAQSSSNEANAPVAPESGT